MLIVNTSVERRPAEFEQLRHAEAVEVALWRSEPTYHSGAADEMVVECGIVAVQSYLQGDWLQMTYHIKLRHPEDVRPTSWKNSWADNDRVTSITTFPAVAERCEQVAKVGGVVRIHRLRHGGEPEKICCECQIAGVTYAKNGIRVEFKNWRVLDLRPPVKRKEETSSSYEA